ncbi:TetR/AcrR family transcriptional regulator [Cryobacterium sp. MLB-32]|uniref:TetR/AcrR family transcriptional regulator n=1 Tax=Cryobacterium sp. MLB-32 TaxID=1529318 RepID=UPI00068EC4C4|nr:TetR/AcrR family transcriptional regulator [Cryobacterium sp. MLB-32]
MSEKPLRAPALSVEDRQSMLIDAVTPLLAEHGQSVTTRQIAECAGVAEGTIFRAFGSKDELIQAAVDRQLDPEPFRVTLRAIDPSQPLEEKVRAIVVLMRERFTTVFTLMTALGRMGPPHRHDPRQDFTEILGRALAPDLERLNVTPDRAAQIIRMVALAASIPQIRVGAAFDADELTSLLLYGLVGGADSRPDDSITHAPVTHAPVTHAPVTHAPVRA